MVHGAQVRKLELVWSKIFTVNRLVAVADCRLLDIMGLNLLVNCCAQSVLSIDVSHTG